MTSAAGAEDLFKGWQFDPEEIIVLCIRWYLRYKLSARDLVEMIAERGVLLANTTFSALGPALGAGVRGALEPVCAASWRFVAI